MNKESIVLKDDLELKNNISSKNSRSNLLLATLLEDLCYLIELDSDKASLLYTDICNKLEKSGFLDGDIYSESQKSRKIVRNFISKLFQNSQMKLIDYKSQDSDKLNVQLIKKPKIKSLIETINNDKLKTDDMKQILTTTSRYNNDFVKLGHLGEGSFGVIDKVYHKLDNKIYAIKKIPFSNKIDKTTFESKLKEVRSLATLSHKNILRYHSSWMEYHYWEENFEGDSSNSITELEGFFLTIFLQTEVCDMSLREWIDIRNKKGKYV